MSAGPKPGAGHARTTCGHGPNATRTPALPLRTPALPSHTHMHSSTTTPRLVNAWCHVSAVSWASLETRDPWCKVVLSSVSVCVSSPTKIKHACVDHLLNCGYRTALYSFSYCIQIHDTGAYCLYCTAGNWASAQVPSSILKFAIAFLLHGPPPWPRQPAAARPPCPTLPPTPIV